MPPILPYAKKPYTKKFATTAELIALLRSRGLVIRDEDLAEHHLKFIGYYRLSGYARPFQIGESHQFKAGTTFEAIIDLYVFDRKLRTLLLDALDRIEIAVRAVINDTIAEKLGPHWYLNKEAFEATFTRDLDYNNLLMKIKDGIGCHLPVERRELFIGHYYRTYDPPELPPGWMVFERVALGTLSRTYSNLASEYQKRIARVLSTYDFLLASQLHAFTHLRNLCAHHCRIWNRKFHVKPSIPNEIRPYQGETDRLAIFIAVIELFLQKIGLDFEWSARFDALLHEHPGVSRWSMGFR